MIKKIITKEKYKKRKRSGMKRGRKEKNTMKRDKRKRNNEEEM